MIDINFLIKKNPAFSIFNIKEADFVFEADPVLDEKRGVIYIIVNLKNGMVYVGLSRRTFNERYYGDWLNKTDNSHLRRAGLKGGRESFGILIMESGRGLNILNILETYYIAKFRANDRRFGYNKTSGGGDTFFFTDEVKEQMRLSSPLLLTTEEFIERCKKKHEDNFDYSKVNYFNSRTDVEITCNICNKTFIQNPEVHFKSKIACPTCALNHKKRLFSMTFEEFQKRSRDKYGDAFILYPETFNRIHGRTKFTHNVCGTTFETTGQSHLVSTTGCPTCGIKYRNQSTRRNSLERTREERQRIAKILNIDNFENLRLRDLNRKLKDKKLVEANQARLLEEHKQWVLDTFQRGRDIHGEDAFTYIDWSETKKERLHLMCNKCGRTLFQKIYDHINLKRGCRQCKMKNKGET